MAMKSEGCVAQQLARADASRTGRAGLGPARSGPPNWARSRPTVYVAPSCFRVPASGGRFRPTCWHLARDFGLFCRTPRGSPAELASKACPHQVLPRGTTKSMLGHHWDGRGCSCERCTRSQVGYADGRAPDCLLSGAQLEAPARHEIGLDRSGQRP